MMIKRNIARSVFVLILTLALTAPVMTVFPEPVYAASGDMNLYAIYLKTNSGEKPGKGDEQEFGDAVLMESGGQYLLMDTGALYVSQSVISYLKKVLPAGAVLNVYISHLHRDHFGALGRIKESGIPLGTVYLPDRNSIGTDYVSSDTGAGIKDILYKYFFMNGIEESQIVWLKKGSKFKVGSVSAEVIGPVGSYKKSDFSNGGEYGEKWEGHYLNNYSLTTMFTTKNGIKYLTTGDIEEKEEKNLASSYGTRLKADILKMAHHGLKSSNCEAFISKVKPVYAFAENMGYEESTSDGKGNKVQRFNTPVKILHDYGMQYMVANEKASLGITVEGRKISLYRDSNNDGRLLPGEELERWVSVAGIAPVSQKNFTGKDNFYIDPATGRPYTGIKKIGKKYYLFSSGGAMHKAYYKGSKYRHYRSYGKRLRYFYTPDKNGRSAIACGVKKVSGHYIYFDKNNGYRYKAKKGTSGKWKKIKYGKYYYAVNIKNGYVKTGGTIKLGKARYKANKKGHLKKKK